MTHDIAIGLDNIANKAKPVDVANYLFNNHKDFALKLKLYIDMEDLNEFVEEETKRKEMEKEK